jgi:hypothetical protein
VADIERGYLENENPEGYLENDYLAGELDDASGFQVQMIINKSTPLGFQAEQIVNASQADGMQAEMVVDTSTSLGFQTNMIAAANVPLGMQVEMVIGALTSLGFQVEQVIEDSTFAGMQASQIFLAVEHATGFQVEGFITEQGTLGISALHDKLRHAILEYYLQYPYLEEPYLVSLMAAYPGLQAAMTINKSVATGMQVNQIIDLVPEAGMQAEMIVNQEHATGMQAAMTVFAESMHGFQVQRVINAMNTYGMQAEMIVNTEHATGFQTQQLRVFKNGMQADMIIYNVTQLRIMWEFPSRGTEALLGLNWVASTTAAGDFAASNVNTDIIEQVWRSSGVPSFQTLTCDTGIVQGVTIDTIAILGHNFTKSATVQVQGSNDNFATPPNVTFNMTTELENMYYISPEFPTIAGQNRYWRFIIQDTTNPAGYVEVGTILFGTSEIFSVTECFTNPITRGYKHFKDAMATEGFTTVSNDRALKRFLRLNFEKLNYFKGNFRILDEMMRFARTSLKVLVIPTPQYPSRFAVYGKLTGLPDIIHEGIDATTEYVDVEFEWDESL